MVGKKRKKGEKRAEAEEGDEKERGRGVSRNSQRGCRVMLSGGGETRIEVPGVFM